MQLDELGHNGEARTTTGSTGTCLFFNRIGDMAAQIRLRLRPFYLGRIFRENGFGPFHPDTARTAYMWRDIARRTRPPVIRRAPR